MIRKAVKPGTLLFFLALFATYDFFVRPWLFSRAVDAAAVEMAFHGLYGVLIGWLLRSWLLLEDAP